MASYTARLTIGWDRYQPDFLARLRPELFLNTLALSDGCAGYLRLARPGMGIEKFLYLAGIDIFTAADDYITGGASEVQASILAHHAQVTCVQPAIGVASPRSWARKASTLAFAKHPGCHAAIILHDGGLQRIDEHCVHLLAQPE